MDNTELHYLTYDPNKIMEEMLVAYMDEGGDILYPGDEKSMLLNAVLAIITQAFAGVDNALRMATLRYAVGDYLDVIGETRMCTRVEAAAAKAKIGITEDASGEGRLLEAGLSVVDSDGVLYTLDEDVELYGTGATVEADITCAETGAKGNAIRTGAYLQFSTPQPGIVSVVCTQDASGGMDRESDDAYRERIRVSGAKNITTGTALQYEAVTKGVSSEIIDASAVNGGNGVVNVYIIVSDSEHAAALIQSVRKALNGNDARPMTDVVNVYQATDMPYTLNVEYYAETGVDIQDAVLDAVEAYQQWQDEVIGRAFNPDMLISKLYVAGCQRVTFGSGSNFNGGAVEYTEIGDGKRCKGTINIERKRA